MKKDSLCYKEMYGCYIQACDAYSHDITGLYLKLERIFSDYYKQGLVKEGEDFMIDVGLGLALRFRFFKNATEIYRSNYKVQDVKEELLLSKEQSARREYDLLRGFGLAMSGLGVAIGRSYPESFKKMLLHIQPGTLLSFTEGKTYVCKENADNIVVFDRVFDGDIKNINIKSFVKNESVRLNMDDIAGLQRFYQTNRKLLTSTMEADYVVLDDCKIRIKEIESDISRMHSKKVTIGPVSFVAKRSLFGDEVIWYSDKGEKVSKDSVAYLLGYLNTKPTFTKYIRKIPSEIKSAEDAEERLKIEHLLEDKKYSEAYHEMIQYSMENAEDLVIRTDSFFKDENGNFKPGSIVFKDGIAYKVFYEANDFKNDIHAVYKLTGDEFERLCKLKYADSFVRVFANTMAEIEKIYESKEKRAMENKKAVAKNKALKEMAEKKSDAVIKESQIMFEQNTELDDIVDNMKDDEFLDYLDGR